jgi:carbonic anhydrase
MHKNKLQKEGISMKQLLKGIVHFKKKDYEEHKELFENLGRKQKPHTLFIGCSDSRVVPNLITKTLPGELFIVRNIANIVPHFRQAAEFLATTSAIEYAVRQLEVENIVVCGHSNCGGCAALYHDEHAFTIMPHTRKWLELAANVKTQVLEQIPEEDPSAREWLTEQINIVEQIKHLFTYPYIKEKFQMGKLHIYGWYYIIETGEIYNYNKNTETFEPAN